MRALSALLLGVVATGALVYVFVAAVALVAATGGSSLRVGVGPLVLVSVVSDARSTTTVFGSGILVVAFVGGVLNLVTAWVLRRRREGEAMT
jgi:Co/Zn/Cd efflux system component